MKHPKQRHQGLVYLISLAFVEALTCGFTFEFSPPAHLPATPESPIVPFVWDGKAPSFQDKETFRGGLYNDSSDEDIMAMAISEAMASWSNVPGSFLKLGYQKSPETAVALRSDRVNSIVIAETNNLNSAAYANPATDKSVEGGRVIVDCDITVDTKSVTIKFMLYALTHEIGHCLGFGHAHDNYHAIMGYSRMPGTALLGADDKAALFYLYGDPNYGDPKVRNALVANCGVVTGAAPSPLGGMMALALLLLPVIGISASRARHRPRFHHF